MLRSMAKYSRATGPQAAAREAARSGSARTLKMPSASGPGATGVRRPAPELAQELLVIAEVGRHDRPAGGEVDGDLALDRVVLAAGQPGMDQDVGPSGQRDDLLGGLTGQDDQAGRRTGRAGRGSARRPRRDRRPGRSGRRARDSKILGRASIRIGTPWLGWTMLPTYMMTLCFGPMPGIDAGGPGRSYSARSMPG